MDTSLVMLRVSALMLMLMVLALALFNRHVTALVAASAADAAADAAAEQVSGAASGTTSDCSVANGRFTPERLHQDAELAAGQAAVHRMEGLMAAAVKDVRVVADGDCNVLVFVDAAAGTGRGGSWVVSAVACRAAASGVVPASGGC